MLEAQARLGPWVINCLHLFIFSVHLLNVTTVRQDVLKHKVIKDKKMSDDKNITMNKFYNVLATPRQNI